MVYLILAYIIFLIIFGIISTAAFYHCWEFGYIGDATKFAMVIYSIIALAIVVVTFFLILAF